jgi:hypothetical protein
LVPFSLLDCTPTTPGKETTQEATTGEITTETNTPDAAATEKQPEAGRVETPIEPSISPDTQPETTPEPPPEPRKTGWQTLPPLTEKRQEIAVVSLRGEVVILGGINNSIKTVPTVEAYNPNTKTWRALADLPEPMHHVNAAVWNDKIYVLGFLKPSFGESGKCFVYDPDANKWTPLKDMPRTQQRGASILGVIDDIIYVAGGLKGLNSVPLFSAYNPKTDTWEEKAQMPTDLDHIAGGVIDGKLILAGGRHGKIEAHIKLTFAYDPTTNKWTEKAKMPTSRGGTAAAVWQGKLYVFGGEGNPNEASKVFASVESYDLKANKWTQHPPMPSPRHGTNAVTIGGVIYIPGGADVQAFGAVSTMEHYVP